MYAQVEDKEAQANLSKVIGEFQDQLTAGQDQTAEAANRYVEALISFSVSRNAQKSVINGWITYTDGTKIRIYGEGPGGADFIGGIGLPLLVLRRDLLLNQNFTYVARGAVVSYFLTLQVRGTEVFGAPVPFAGTFNPWADIQGRGRLTAE